MAARMDALMEEVRLVQIVYTLIVAICGFVLGYMASLLTQRVKNDKYKL